MPNKTRNVGRHPDDLYEKWVLAAKLKKRESTAAWCKEVLDREARKIINQSRYIRKGSPG